MGGARHSRVGSKPGDRHRGHGREIVRVEHREQAIGELGELVVEPVLHARAEKGDAFEQAADVRIVDGILRQPQAAGDLGMAFGEFAGQPAQRFEFAVEIGEQGVGHRLRFLFEDRHVLGDEIDDGVEGDRFGRRLRPQQRVDAQPQRAAHLVGGLDQRDLEAGDARLEAADAGSR